MLLTVFPLAGAAAVRWRTSRNLSLRCFFFRAFLGVKAGGREGMPVVVGIVIRSRIQSLTAFGGEYAKSPAEDNGSGSGLVSRAQMPLKFEPQKEGICSDPRCLLMRPLDLHVTP